MELLTVIVILGVIISLVLPLFKDSSAQAEVAASLTTLQTVRKQLANASTEHGGTFPDLSGEDPWLFLLSSTKQTSSSNGTYTLSDETDGASVGPYLLNTPVNTIENSSSIAASNQSPGVGFIYNQNSGNIKLVAPQELITSFELSSRDFAAY